MWRAWITPGSPPIREPWNAFIRNLEVIGEAARGLPADIKDAIPQTEWRKVVGLRNLLLHEYFAVSTRVVWDVVQTKLDPLRIACRNALTEGSGGPRSDTLDR